MKRLGAVSKTPPKRASPYARIYFDARAEFGVPITDYVLIEMVFVLSRSRGWCYASREYFARLLGVSSRSIQRSLLRAKDQGLVEEHPEHSRLLRPTARWIETVRRSQGS